MGVIYGLYCSCDSCSDFEIRYVGQSINFARRFDRHLRDAPHHALPLGRWIVKHGRENICYKILEEVENEFLNEREVFWIAELDTFLKTNPRGLNCTTGGDSGHIGVERPESVKEQIAATLRGRTRDPEIALKTKRTRHEREHQNGPPKRSKCIFCYPDGRPEKRWATHSQFHEPEGYWVEDCPDCDDDFKQGRPSKKEHQATMNGPKVRFGKNPASHSRWHVNRGILNPECPHCLSGQSSESD